MFVSMNFKLIYKSQVFRGRVKGQITPKKRVRTRYKMRAICTNVRGVIYPWVSPDQ